MASPSLRERFRPAELLGLSAVLALFLGLVILLTTRDWIFAIIGFGIGFIVAVVIIAMLTMVVKPGEVEEQDTEKPRLHD